MTLNGLSSALIRDSILIKRLKILHIFWAPALALFLGVLLSAASDPESPEQTSQRVCSQCHGAERIYEMKKTSLGWQRTVAWMKRHPGAAFSDEEGQMVVQHLVAFHADYPELLCYSKCGICHSPKSFNRLRGSLRFWQRIVRRERTRAAALIALDEAEDIAQYLARVFPGPELSGPQTQARELTEDKCLRCHTYATVFKRRYPGDQWRSINSRMQSKCPWWISEGELETINTFLTSRRK